MEILAAHIKQLPGVFCFFPSWLPQGADHPQASGPGARGQAAAEKLRRWLAGSEESWPDAGESEAIHLVMTNIAMV